MGRTTHNKRTETTGTRRAGGRGRGNSVRHAIVHRLPLKVLAMVLFSVSTALAQQGVEKFDTYTKYKLHAGQQSAKERETALGAGELFSVIVRGYPADIRAAVEQYGGRVHTEIGDIVTAEVSREGLYALASVRSVSRIESSRPLRFHNDEAVRHVGADRVWQMRRPDGGTGYTGKDVIVGIVDSGIDFTHFDFRNPGDTTTTRILALWDHSATTGTPPQGFTYGAEWTQQQINTALRTGDYSTITHRDTLAEGHGTHVAGTAAGNGLATGAFRGVAPDADIVVVAINGENTAAVVDGAKYIFDLAASLNKPAVVNMSLGFDDEAHDGTSLIDQGLNALLLERNGRAICVSAGNAGEGEEHWGAYEFADDTVWTYALARSAQASEGMTRLPIVYQGTVQLADGEDAYMAVGLDEMIVDEDMIVWNQPVVQTEWISLRERARQEPYSDVLVFNSEVYGGDVLISVTAADANTFGVMVVVSDSIREPVAGRTPFVDGMDLYRVLFRGSGTVNMWNVAGGPVSEDEHAVLTDDDFRGWERSYAIGSPGTAHNVITVGAYTNIEKFINFPGNERFIDDAGAVGELASFSSVGPTADGRQKPEIVAPGHGVISALCSWVNVDKQNDFTLVAQDGKHWAMSGTSMSSPVVTGAVALMLQKNPSLSFEDIRYAITHYAETDDQTAMFGDLPNGHWGYGKLDIYSSMAGVFTGVHYTPSAPDGIVLEAVYPNPVQDLATVAYSIPSRLPVQLDVVDLFGRQVAVLFSGMAEPGSYRTHLEATQLPPGLYLCRLTAGGTTVERSVVVMR